MEMMSEPEKALGVLISAYEVAANSMYERHPGISAEECKKLTEDITPFLKMDQFFQELFLSAAQVVRAKRLIKTKEATGELKPAPMICHVPDYKPTGVLAATPHAPDPSAGSQTLTPPSEEPLK